MYWNPQASMMAGSFQSQSPCNYTFPSILMIDKNNKSGIQLFLSACILSCYYGLPFDSDFKGDSRFGIFWNVFNLEDCIQKCDLDSSQN